MKKYWIIVNGQPQGPFTAQEIHLRSDFRADLPIWYSGLPKWITVAEDPELSAMLSRPIDVEPISEPTAATPENPRYDNRTSWENIGRYRNVTDQCHTAASAHYDVITPPPSYLVWNILLTICCCIPVGIIGIIFSCRVNQKVKAGDIEGAKKASDAAAWCLILAFTLGIMTLPFQMLMI